MLDLTGFAADALDLLLGLLPADIPWKIFLLGWITMSLPVTALTLGLLRRYRAS